MLGSWCCISQGVHFHTPGFLSSEQQTRQGAESLPTEEEWTAAINAAGPGARQQGNLLLPTPPCALLGVPMATASGGAHSSIFCGRKKNHAQGVSQPSGEAGHSLQVGRLERLGLGTLLRPDFVPLCTLSKRIVRPLEKKG